MKEQTTPDIVKVPVASIRVVNPRARNKRIFGELVTSIAHLGLKKPITVARRNGRGFDLVCGQGRLEAFLELGQKEIPAILVEATEEDCFVMSLVENLARRHHTPLELIREIGSLKTRGYSTGRIAEKIDLSSEYVYAVCYLLEHGEERLLTAVEKGQIPHTIAMEIARAKDGDVQKALAEAYEANAIPGNQVLTIRKIIEQRSLLGKASPAAGPRTTAKRPVTSSALVRAFRKEADRQKLLVKKAGLTQSRLVFVVNALRMLLADTQFTKLLRAEQLYTLPRPLAERIKNPGG